MLQVISIRWMVCERNVLCWTNSIHLWYFCKLCITGKISLHVCKKNPALTMLCKRTRYRIVERIWMTHPVLEKNRISKYVCCNKWNLLILVPEWRKAKGNLWAHWLFRVACHNLQSTGQHDLLKLYSYKSGPIQMLFHLDWEARSWYCSWFQESLASRFIDPELLLFLDKAQFTLMGMWGHRVTFWCYENSSAFHEVLSV
jgi:hypothetical protein